MGRARKMHGRGIKPFTKRVEDCRKSLSQQTVNSGREYVKWLEDEPKRRMAEMIEKDRSTGGFSIAKDILCTD